MDSFPTHIGGRVVLAATRIDNRHTATGASERRRVDASGEEKLIEFAAGLAICLGDGEKFELIGCNADWEPLWVTGCQSITDAKDQAEFEYRGTHATWEQVEFDEAGGLEIKDSVADSKPSLDLPSSTREMVGAIIGCVVLLGLVAWALSSWLGRLTGVLRSFPCVVFLILASIACILLAVFGSIKTKRSRRVAIWIIIGISLAMFLSAVAFCAVSIWARLHALGV